MWVVWKRICFHIIMKVNHLTFLLNMRGCVWLFSGILMPDGRVMRQCCGKNFIPVNPLSFKLLVVTVHKLPHYLCVTSDCF